MTQNEKENRTNKNTKVFIYSAASIFIILIIGIWISTQWVASLLHYHHQLGSPFITISGYPLYAPFKFFTWWYYYGVYAPRAFDKAATAIYVTVFIFFLFAVAAAIWRSRRPKDLSAHGTARWATIEDIEKTGLLDGKGIVLGKVDGRYLRHDGPEHAMLMAPTRSGKGVSTVIPTLLSWPHSCIVTDIKGENFGISAGYRQSHLKNKILKFDPTAQNKSSVRFNPLDEIRIRQKIEVRDVQNIADILVDPHGKGDLDHWAKTGHALLVGVILHVKYTLGNSANLSTIAMFLSNPSLTFEETLVLMMHTAHAPDPKVFEDLYGVSSQTHPIVAQSARELLNKAEKERSSVLSTAMSFLGLYRDPIISYNTAVSEFQITDLMNSDDPVSLFLVFPPSDINRTRPLFRIILNQVVARLTESMEFKDGKPVVKYKHRLLLLLDEFPALGKLEAFESALAFIAGYGLKALLIVQSINQLNKIYTNNNSITDNCHVRVVFTPNDPNTPKFISDMLGTKTEVVENQSFSGHRLNAWLGRMSVSTSQTARPLMTPGEVSTMPKTKNIILIGGQPPIMADMNFYFKDQNFISRLLPAPVISDRLIELPQNDPVLDLSISVLFPGVDISALKSNPAYKDYFQEDLSEVNSLKSLDIAPSDDEDLDEGEGEKPQDPEDQTETDMEKDFA